MIIIITIVLSYLISSLAASHVFRSGKIHDCIPHFC